MSESGRVVVTGLGVVAPNATGKVPYEKALRSGTSGIRHIPLLAELKYACQVAGVPQGVDEVAEQYFADDELKAMNSSHHYGCIAAVDALVEPDHGQLLKCRASLSDRSDAGGDDPG